ncbi:unnamed protein product [Somion occarium]|uniref:ATP-binding cassette transporter n=1 Tax=Somion occarium TaxID=3059160 RepID=A0ABP1CKM6_9APHY
MIRDTGQVVLNRFGLWQVVGDDALWRNTLLVPSYVAGVSTLLLVGQAIAIALHRRKNVSDDVEESSTRLRGHISALGGPIIFTFKLARLVACLALVVLSAVSMYKVSSHLDFSHTGLTHAALCATFIYASLLAILTVVTKPLWNSLITKHLIIVLLAPWAVYVYRDLWPLATYTLSPADSAEGWLIWTKVIVLTFAAIVVPLLMPRQYVPFDPLNPSLVPHPEQTTSWLSMVLFAYLTPFVFKAYKQPRLTLEDLPPMNDRDTLKNLISESYADLDPLQNKKKRHVLFGLVLRVYLFDHVKMAVMLILHVIGSFAAPIGINYLLKYLETGGENAIVRPWFWIAWLFFGPLISGMTFNLYFYIALRTIVRAQGVLTQLIFDHALRIRVQGDVKEDSLTQESPASEHPSPEGSSNARGGSSSDVDEETVASSTSFDAKADDQSSETPKQESKPNTANLAGRLNNLVTSDMSNVHGGQGFMLLMFYVPTQLTLSLIYLYSLLGWSVLPGVAAMALLSPLPGYVVKALSSMQTEKMKKSDARVQSVTESMNVIRMIKQFGWEDKMSALLDGRRQEELKFVRKLRLLELATMNISAFIPCATMIVTYGIYTLAMGRELTASRVFASVAVFGIVQEHFQGIFFLFPGLIQAKVSIDRINDFLSKTELLDQFSTGSSAATSTPSASSEICIRQAAFTWSSDTEDVNLPASSQRSFALRIEDELIFKRGRINLVVGQTGSGKTSLLMALLGEMHNIPLGPQSLVNLPRERGIAYHAQESWVLNETIRNNILFGAPYDEERYNAVIEQCALERDLGLFDAGDQTEVGEKGITLSGGQKARVTLARAVYSSADILLLDDVLAALDVHTSRWIVDKCFRGDLMRGRTVILVTHNVALATPISDFVVSLGSDGRILSQGSLSTALAKDQQLSAEAAKESEVIEKAEHEVDQETGDKTPKTTDGKLVTAEEVSEGHVSWSAMKLLLVNMAGKPGAIVFWGAFLVLGLVTRTMSNLDIWIIGLWARQYELQDPQDVSVAFYMSLYLVNMLSGMLVFSAAFLLFVFGSMRASRAIHRLLINSVFSATLRWLDRTPVSRIITRCSQDIQSIDSTLSQMLLNLFDVTFTIVVKFLAVILLSPIFLFPGLVLVAVGIWFGHIYMQAQLPVKRESSNARAPVLGHFGAAITGLVSIRAYGAQEMFRQELYRRTDRYTRVTREFWNLNRWIVIQTDVLAGMFCASLAAYLIYSGHMDASKTGFSINMAIGFSGMILLWVRMFNRVETEGNS